MRRWITTLCLAAAGFWTSQVAAQESAYLRVAHLSPDAPNVDVWLDGERVLEDVPFEAVSDYLPVPAGTRNVQVSPAGETEPIVIDADVELEAGAAYTAAATGLLGDSDLEPLVLVDDRQPEAGKVQVRFVHTSPDAPAVDVAVTGGPVLFNDLSFREASDYLTVLGGRYDLEVRLAGTDTVALSVPGVLLKANRTYSVFAVGLAGESTLAALPVVDGTPALVAPRPPFSGFVPPGKALVRVAHLSPDAPAVDVWVDGERAVEALVYPEITDYLKVPAGDRDVQVTPAGADEPVVIGATLTLSEGTAYTVAATGLLGDEDLAPLVLVDDRNPEVDTVKVRFAHTSPDAPGVDIAVTGGPVLFNSVAFRETSEYLRVDPGNYDLEVRVAGTTDVALELPGVRLLGGTNYTVFAIGLLADETLAALPAVDAELPLDLPALRAAHLSPDAPAVDVWVDGEVAVASVEYLAVSDYLPLTAGPHRIQVTPAGETEPVVIDAEVSLESGVRYTVAATGLLGDEDLVPLVLVDERTPGGGSTSVRFAHASPDAPAVDVAVAGGDVLFGDVEFREFTEYLDVPPGRYDLEVRVAGTTDVALDVPGVVLPAGQNYTVYAVGLLSDESLGAVKVSDAKGPFLRGDSNGDGGIDISDPINTLIHLFVQDVPIASDAADANDDNAVNMADAMYTLNYLFGGGDHPEAPFPGLGLDPTPDFLGGSKIR